MSAKVTVRDLQKRYGGVEAARGVSFDVEDGEIFGLLGPNGAGKTTTLECVIGLREPDAGDIVISGIDRRRHPREVKQKIGAALQTTALQDKMTPREALALFGSFYAQSVSPAELIDRFALTAKADAAFETLSGGQRQRLALALAFVNRPELVFLDEPTAGLDPQSRHELHGEIARMKDEGHTVLLTTHYLEEAEAVCDRVGIIDKGRIIATGRPGEITARSNRTPLVTIETSGPIDPASLGGIAGLEGLTVDGIRVTGRATDVARVVGEMMARLTAAHVEVRELHVQKATLEEAFLELTSAP